MEKDKHIQIQLKALMSLIYAFILLNVTSLSGQDIPVVNFPVFTQTVAEGDSLVHVLLSFDPVLQENAWVKIIQEVSSTVDFKNDLIFDNPLIIDCSAGDSLITFSIGIVDDNEIERTEQIMLAIESTSENMLTGPDGEHVVFLDDNDCNLSILNLSNEICADTVEAFTLQAVPPGGIFEGPGIIDSTFNAQSLDTGQYVIHYYVNMGSMCVDTLFHSITITQCTTTSIEDDLTDKSKVHIYPNPASSYFILEVNKPVIPRAIELFDISGNIIQTSEKLQIGTNDIIDIPSGIYFLKIYINDQSITQKIIII